jgi:hypothetical protein
MSGRFGSAALAALLLLGTGGCLAYSVTNSATSGQAIGAGLFDRISAGMTASWARANLGEPTSKAVDGSDEVWRYQRTDHATHYDMIVFVYFGSNNTDHDESAFIEFKDGCVVAKWRG